MMFQTTMLNAAGIGHYRISLGQSPRRDLGSHYTRLSAEVVLFAEDGTNLMIENGWLEQPPEAADREQLSKR
jgi:hypothetical protein